MVWLLWVALHRDVWQPAMALDLATLPTHPSAARRARQEWPALWQALAAFLSQCASMAWSEPPATAVLDLPEVAAIQGCAFLGPVGLAHADTAALWSRDALLVRAANHAVGGRAGVWLTRARPGGRQRARVGPTRHGSRP